MAQGFASAGDAGARANVAFGPFIDGQCFWGLGRSAGGEMLMHSDLINSAGLLNASPGPIPAVTPDVCNTLSPNPSPSMGRRLVAQDPGLKSKIRRGGTQDSPDPLKLIAEGNMRLLDIARASGMSILELAAHVCTAQNLETLARVKQLHATQR